MLRSLIHLALIFVRGESYSPQLQSSFNSSTCIHLVSAAPFLKDGVFSLMYVFYIFVKTQVALVHGFLCGSFILSH